MDRNVGGLDRTARLSGGTLLALVGIVVLLDIVALGPIVGGVFLAAGVIFLATGAVQWCPINQAIGLNTCSQN